MAEKFEFLKELNETKMFRNLSVMHNMHAKQIVDLFFLHVIGLEIIKNNYSTMRDAQNYARLIYRYKNFSGPQYSSNDMYQLAYALVDKEEVLDDTKYKNDSVYTDRIHFDKNQFIQYITRIANNNINYQADRRYTLKLSYDLKQDSIYSSMRRLAIDWETLSRMQKQLLMTRLLQAFRAKGYQSDLFPYLNKIANEQKLHLTDVFNPETGEWENETKKEEPSLLKKLAVNAAVAGGIYAGYKYMTRDKK
jgi:hypothetical protein